MIRRTYDEERRSFFIKRRNVIYFSNLTKYEDTRIKGIFLMAKMKR